MDSLNCPLTCDIFCDPVIGQDGHTYERKDITTWLQQHGTSPITREPMSIESLRPNHIVRKMMEEFTAISKKKDYQFLLDIDVRKTQTQPLLQTMSKTIYKAEWIGRQGPSIVLIKIDGAKANYEALFYVQLSCHPYIVRTFGLVESDQNAVMLLQEHAEQGNLADLLRKNKFKPTRDVLVEIFTQIIDAMICLADNKIIHGDLACQNVLVFRCNSHVPEENLVKLTDFGLTKGSDIFSMATSSSKIPMAIISVRYAAPEILRTSNDRTFYSEKSDVYSMAVLMWEACSYGKVPFDSLVDDSDVRRCKLRGDHLPRPAICDEGLWSAIVLCWKLEPNERPTFKELRRKIMRFADRSDFTAYNPGLEIEEMSHIPSMPTPSSNDNAERLSPVNFEAHEDMIPCERCEELVNFDQYIIHTQLCTGEQQQRVVKKIRPVQPTQITTTTTRTQSVLDWKWEKGNVEITVSALNQTAKNSSLVTVYRIMTRSSQPIFKRTQFAVNRRSTDFVTIHGKLVVKHLPKGIIIPALPEHDSSIEPKDIKERQRAQFERYLNRLVRNKTLVCDADFLVFLELPEELPKATNTLWRNLLSISITKSQKEKGDCFDEKQKFIIDLQTDLKGLKSHFDHLYKLRENSCVTDNEFAVQLNMLATYEDHPLLCLALIELAGVQEKLEQINSNGNQQEFALMNELLNEYILHLDMVKYVFNERAKLHKSWLASTDTLQKKAHAKGHHAEIETQTLQEKIVSDMENYEQMSMTLEKELEMFEEDKMEEFKDNIHTYIQQMLEKQEKILQIWEAYLPIANSIALTAP